MIPVSIVIITKNEADIIGKCIKKATLITDDIVIVDNGSTDDTLAIAAGYGCRIYEKPWESYGANKNRGNNLAKYNWILSIDADEVPDDELVRSLQDIPFNDDKVVYDIKFRSYYGLKPVRFGNWGRDHHIRLFNRNYVQWSETIVHESLILGNDIKVKKLRGRLHHYSVNNVEEYNQKSKYYARLCAEKYLQGGKRFSILRQYLSPVFGFIKSYVILLGFLDGRKGWLIAKTSVINTKRKYVYLNQLEMYAQKKLPVDEGFVIEY